MLIMAKIEAGHNVDPFLRCPGPEVAPECAEGVFPSICAFPNGLTCTMANGDETVHPAHADNPYAGEDWPSCIVAGIIPFEQSCRFWTARRILKPPGPLF